MLPGPSGQVKGPRVLPGAASLHNYESFGAELRG